MKSRFWKKTAAGLLALLIVTGNTPAASFIRLTERPAVTVCAADELLSGQCGESAYWSLDSATGTLTISGEGDMDDYDMETQPWGDYNSAITSVSIGDGITSIGTHAFANCENLTSISLSDNITEIRMGAFWLCSSLEEIIIPASVTYIGQDAFYRCTDITEFQCDADPAKLTWDDGTCDDFKDDGTTVCHVPGEYYLEYVKKFGAESESPVNVTFGTDAPHGQCGDSAYWLLDSGKLTISGTGDIDFDDWVDYKGEITSVEIENGITSIVPSAFDECEYLTSVEIPDSVTYIGVNAFKNCTGITDVYCYADPANLTWDDGGYDDFKLDGTTVCHVSEEYYDTYVSKFGIGSETPVNVTFKAEAMGKCGEHAYWFFDSDTGKLTISGTGNMDSVGWADHRGEISSVVIERGITYIGDSAFEGFAALNSVTIPNSVESIGMFAFASCGSLESVNIPDCVTDIGDYAFAWCDSLESVNIPDSVTYIGYYAFLGCESLESVNIPDSVTYIGL
ncbi:MAG: leucine-rich repeat domain-containing protein, partial [Oscillospiraceae bacterium]|nr:leucine-rich repeat domain-containing protein [Oscillospiraceae bacterium]